MAHDVIHAVEDAKREVEAESAVGKSGLQAKYERSFAVLIGINGYEDPLPRLSCAANDACAVARRLVETFHFPVEDVHVLVDQATEELPEALRPKAGAPMSPTKENIEKLLLDELPKQLGPDDRLLVFFSGHGEPNEFTGADRTTQRDWYMVPLGGKKGEWSTLVDIEQVFRAINRSRVKHVLYLLDACFSGIAGQKKGSEEAMPFQEDMLCSVARQGLSASSARQTADDSGTRGKNSRFTEVVLDVLDGKINPRRHKAITASELAYWVRDRVMSSRGSSQRPEPFTLLPHEGGDFVFEIPRSFLSASERVRLAGILVEDLGIGREERWPLVFAKSLLDQEGGDLTPAEAAEVPRIRRRLGYGLVRLSGIPLGGAESSEEPLLGVTGKEEGDDKQDVSSPPPLPEERLLAALGAYRSGDRGAARRELTSLAGEVGSGPGRALAEWLLPKVSESGRRVAVLVGIGTLDHLGAKLTGPRNDVEGLRQVLAERVGFTEIECLLDVTAGAVVERLRHFASTLGPDDTFLFYFGGNGLLRDAHLQKVAIYTFRDARGPAPGAREYDGPWDAESGYLTEMELDRLLADIRATDKVVITDGCHLGPLEPRSGYRFFAGCGRTETSFESALPDGTTRGVFSHALERALANRPSAPLQVIFRTVDAAVRQKFPQQHPSLAGARLSEPLIALNARVIDCLDLAVRWDAARGRDIQSTESLLDKDSPAVLWRCVARAYGRREQFYNAAERLQAYVGVDESTAREHVETCVGAGDYAKAAQVSPIWAGAAPPKIAEKLAVLTTRLAVAGHRTKRALLVSDRLARNEQLVRRSAAWFHALGFRAENVVWKGLHELPPEALRAEVQKLVRTPEDPALLVLEGPSHAIPTFAYLAEICGEPPALTCILPASILPASPASAKVGALTIWVDQGAHEREVRPAGAVVTRTERLLTALQNDGVWTAEQWVASAQLQGAAEIVGDRRARLFELPDDAIAIHRLLREITLAPLDEAELLLSKMRSQPGGAGEEAGLFQGVTLLACGRADEALDAINEALRLREERAAKGDEEGASGKDGRVRWPAAHYHRGQALLAVEPPRLGEAADAFALSVEQCPDDPLAHYHRAIAVQRLIAEDLATQGQKARDEYELRGAPLGPLDQALGLTR